MNTQTHLLLGAAVFCRPGRPAANTAVVAGALVPDAALFGMFVWSKLAGMPETVFWTEFYFAGPAQTIQALANSAPLYAALLLIGAVIARPAPAELFGKEGGTPLHGRLLVLFALAALTHLAGDFPVHVADAHRHFWPFSDWRFRSPVSYWDPDHYGAWFSLFEIALGVSLAAILFRRFPALWIRALMVLAILLYIAVPAWFMLMIDGHEM